MPKNKPDPKNCIFLPQYCPRQVMHIPCPGSIPRGSHQTQPCHKNASSSETLQVVLLQGEHQRWESSLHTLRELCWAPPAAERVSSTPQTIETQAPTPLVPKASPQGERWNGKRMARTKRQKLCRKPGILSARNGRNPRPCSLPVCPHPKIGRAGTQSAAQGVQPHAHTSAPNPQIRSCTEPQGPRDSRTLVPQSMGSGCVPVQQPWQGCMELPLPKQPPFGHPPNQGSVRIVLKQS